MKGFHRLFSRGSVHVYNRASISVYILVSFSSKEIKDFDAMFKAANLVEAKVQVAIEQIRQKPGFVEISPGGAAGPTEFRRDGEEIFVSLATASSDPPSFYEDGRMKLNVRTRNYAPPDHRSIIVNPDLTLSASKFHSRDGELQTTLVDPRCARKCKKESPDDNDVVDDDDDVEDRFLNHDYAVEEEYEECDGAVEEECEGCDDVWEICDGDLKGQLYRAADVTKIVMFTKIWD